jgi:hypothetical protein
MDTSHGGPLAVALKDLQHIFGERLQTFASYGQPGGGPAASLALLRAITPDDLTACAARATAWHRAGCATPLLLTTAEFAGSLDAFPIEYGEILDTHRVLFGADLFAGLAIRPEDLRRACEVQVKSHLLHLREDYVECAARPSDVAALVAASAPAFALLLRRLARLDGFEARSNGDLAKYAAGRPGLDARVVGDVLSLANDGGSGSVDAMRIYPSYVAAVERLWSFIDSWRADAGR